MPLSHETDSGLRLSTAVVVGVTEAACMTWSKDGLVSVAFAAQFPSPRTDRVSPGHLVAIATAADGRSVVVWRWFDVVILEGGDPDSVRLWEPGHGIVIGCQNDQRQLRTPGSRAYASVGLHGVEWWLEGPIVEDPSKANVELDMVRALYDDNQMWSSAFSGTL